MTRPITLAALAALALPALAAAPARADIIGDTLVYIECRDTAHPEPRRGSGVVISASGMVLTARHVVFGAEARRPEGLDCKGAIRHRNLPPSTLSFNLASTTYDAAVLKLPAAENMPHQRFCPLSPAMIRQAVIATGFPRLTSTGVPSSRQGILSTLEPDADGWIETDSATTTGMSGGMVTLARGGALIGIVSGAQPDPSTGYPNSFAVLAAERLAPEFAQFGLAAHDAATCAGLPPVGPVMGTLPDGRPWQAGDPDLPLGMRADQGLCAITRVWGEFDHPADSVAIGLDDAGGYVLRGTNAGQGAHGAEARCIRAD